MPGENSKLVNDSRQTPNVDQAISHSSLILTISCASLAVNILSVKQVAENRSTAQAIASVSADPTERAEADETGRVVNQAWVVKQFLKGKFETEQRMLKRSMRLARFASVRDGGKATTTRWLSRQRGVGVIFRPYGRNGGNG